MQPDEFWRLGKGPVEPHMLDSWTVPRIFNRRAQSHPTQVMYRASDGVGLKDWTWGAMRERVALHAASLKALGIERDDRVAVLGSPSPEWVALDFAIVAAGGITAGIYPTASVEEAVEQTGHLGAKVFLVLDHQQAAEIVAGVQESGTAETIVWDGPDRPQGVLSLADYQEGGRRLSPDPGALLDELAEEGSVDDPMRLFFTSGSTGRPKAVIHTQRSLLLGCDAIVVRHPPMRQVPQRVVAFQPMSHIVAVFNNILLPLITDTIAHFVASDGEVTDLIRRVRPTYLPLMPRQYQKLAAEVAERTGRYEGLRKALYRRAFAAGHEIVTRRWAGRAIPPRLLLAHRLGHRLLFLPILRALGLDAVTRAQTTSAAMPREVAVLWCIFGLDLREGYGSSEAPVIAVQLDPFPEPGRVGRKPPRDWFELKIAEDGEVLVRSPTLFTGYWKDAEATREAFTNGWFRTGDLGELDAQGNLRLIGRKKDVIITAGGKTLSPADIEAPLRGSPYVSEVVAIGEGRKYVTALIELAPDAVRARLRREGLPGADSDHEQLAASADVQAMIAAEVERTRHKVARVAQIKRFRILPRPLLAEQGELTATRKIRRSVVLENFATLVESMYDAAEEDAIAQQFNLLRD